MSYLEKYTQAKHNLDSAKNWANLIGNTYHGGGGGVGRLNRVTATMTIYHQKYDGVRNYHESSKVFNCYLESAIKKHSAMLIAETLNMMDNEKTELAKKALDENKLLTQKAGL
jgi:hypothetical protein